MTDKKRRQFVSLIGAGAAAVPLSALVGSLPSRARAQDELPMVDPDSAMAEQFEYVEVTPVEGQRCNNCMFYGGEEGSENGPCPIFGNQAVTAEGWCNVWQQAS